jgi:hypothetical protein
MGNVTARDHMEDLGVDERMIAEWTLGKWSEKMWTGSIWMGIGATSGIL